MLKTAEIVKTPSVERLLSLWAEFYATDITLFSGDSSYSELLQAASSQGRTLTVAKFKDIFLDVNCQMAGIKAKSLYATFSNLLDLNDARDITQLAFEIYKLLFNIYKHDLNQDLLAAALESRTINSVGEKKIFWGSAQIEQIALKLEPILLAFQQQHIASNDWRSLGFLTTQLNFTNKLILNRLTEVEAALLSPYFKFLEEQVAIPWQRVCAAAAKHDLRSPNFLLVEQMLPMAEEISKTTYAQLVLMFREHRSRRGGLKEPGITHSCIRDLNMFQAYLWLSVLEGSFAPFEELAQLCVMVMESVEVKWEMTRQWSIILSENILNRLQLQQKALLIPYALGMQKTFLQKRSHLGYREEAVASLA